MIINFGVIFLLYRTGNMYQKKPAGGFGTQKNGVGPLSSGEAD
jgi:hypothetical protein